MAVEAYTFYSFQMSATLLQSLSYIKNESATSVVKIRKVVVNNSQTAAVTGVGKRIELRKYGADFAVLGNLQRSVIKNNPGSEKLSVDIVCGVASSVSSGTLVGTLDRMFWSTDETSISSTTNDELQCFSHLSTLYSWCGHADVQPITLRSGEALVVLDVTGGAGLIDVIITFTEE